MAVVIILAALLITVCMNHPAEASSTLQLRFYGTVAQCQAKIVENGQIDAVMELYERSVMVFSWSGSGYRCLEMDKNTEVLPGRTYTLKLKASLNGIPLPEKSVTRTNFEMNGIPGEIG